MNKRKMINKWLLLIGIILIFWGGYDFYSVVTTGKELLSYYDGIQIIKELVSYSFVSGIVKIGIGILAVSLSIFQFTSLKDRRK